MIVIIMFFLFFLGGGRVWSAGQRTILPSAKSTTEPQHCVAHTTPNRAAVRCKACEALALSLRDRELPRPAWPRDAAGFSMSVHIDLARPRSVTWKQGPARTLEQEVGHRQVEPLSRRELRNDLAGVPAQAIRPDVVLARDVAIE